MRGKLGFPLVTCAGPRPGPAYGDTAFAGWGGNPSIGAYVAAANASGSSAARQSRRDSASSTTPANSGTR